MTYEEAEALLLDLPRFADQGAAAMNPGLERVTALLEAMGRPHDRLRAVHVAGTNGKGSTASMLAAIGTASGLRVGLHTSPHLWRLAERMRIDGRPAPDDWIASAVTEFSAAIASVRPSFFETTVALSFLYFARERVDLAVVEVGLGGRLDATNVLRPVVGLVTRIARDHEDILGSSLPGIAREKAGIAKPGMPLLTSVESGETLEAIVEEADRRGAAPEAIRSTCSAEVADESRDGIVVRLQTPRRRYESLRVALSGRHQLWNTALAVRAAEHLPDIDPDAIPDGLSRVRELSGLRGRSEVLQDTPLILIDVAHNPDGIAAALSVFRRTAAGRRHVVLGLMRDKNVHEIVDLLRAEDLSVTPAELAGDRSLPAHRLYDLLLQAGVNAEPPGRVYEAVDRFRRGALRDDGLLVTGSHLAVGELRPAGPSFS